MKAGGGPPIGRRTMIQGITASAMIAGAAPARAAAPRKRFVQVGVGSRARMFQDAIWGPHRAHAELVAICDVNPGRLALVGRRAAQAGAASPRTYLAADFDRMLREQRPDALIVCPPDAFHDDYIVRALDAGLDVITEKPMTTDAARAQRILDAARRSGKHIRVTFNYRYSPFRTRLKNLWMPAEMGAVCPVDFNCLLTPV